MRRLPEEAKKKSCRIPKQEEEPIGKDVTMCVVWKDVTMYVCCVECTLLSENSVSDRVRPLYRYTV